MIERNFWRDMRRMQRKMNQFFRYPDFHENDFDISERPMNFRRPRANCRETEDSFLIAMEIPGVSKEDISIEIVDNQLVIKAEKKQEKKEKQDPNSCDCRNDDCMCTYSYSKAYAGFYRTVSLPENAELDKIDAIYENGILKVKIGKRKSAKEKKFVKVR